MKSHQIVFPLVLALAATLATTGCKHKAPKVTNIPGPQPAYVGGDNTGGTLPGGGTVGGMDTSGGVGSTEGGGATAALDLFEGMIKDPAA
ncbi:MAG TPA: hypothetical protein VFF11_15970, partial [Candidatus Binatia bacterium]|nr:hypothetical protein [Candidatus Binatia bacterium]